MLAPGESPGCIDFSGNVTFNFTSVLVIEIGGLVSCTEHDQINVANTLTLTSGSIISVQVSAKERPVPVQTHRPGGNPVLPLWVVNRLLDIYQIVIL